MKKILCVVIFTCFMAVGFSADLTLQWTNSDSPAVTGYNLYRSTVADGPYNLVNTSLIPEDPSDKSQFTDATVSYNERYYYVCRAVVEWDDPAGDSGILESINSNEATEFMMPSTPHPPGLLKNLSTP